MLKTWTNSPTTSAFRPDPRPRIRPSDTSCPDEVPYTQSSSPTSPTPRPGSRDTGRVEGLERGTDLRDSGRDFQTVYVLR